MAGCLETPERGCKSQLPSSIGAGRHWDVTHLSCKRASSARATNLQPPGESNDSNPKKSVAVGDQTSLGSDMLKSTQKCINLKVVHLAWLQSTRMRDDMGMMSMEDCLNFT